MTLKDDLDKMRERFPYSTPVSDTHRWYIGVNDDYIEQESHGSYEDAVEYAKVIINAVGTWKVDIEEQDENGTVIDVEVVYLDAILARFNKFDTTDFGAVIRQANQEQDAELATMSGESLEGVKRASQRQGLYRINDALTALANEFGVAEGMTEDDYDELLNDLTHLVAEKFRVTS